MLLIRSYPFRTVIGAIASVARPASWGVVGVLFVLFPGPAMAADPTLLTSTSVSCAMPNQVMATPPTPLSTLSPGQANYLFSLTSTMMVGSVTSTSGADPASGADVKPTEYFSGGDRIWGETSDGSLSILCAHSSGTADIQYYTVPSLALGSPVTFSGTLSPGTSCAGESVGCQPTATGQPAADSLFELANEDFNPGTEDPSSTSFYDALPLDSENLTVSDGGTLADAGTGNAGPLIPAGTQPTDPIQLPAIWRLAVTGEHSAVQFNYTLTITETGCPAHYERHATGGTSPINACVPIARKPPSPAHAAPRAVTRAMRHYLQTHLANGFAYRAPISVTCTRAAAHRYHCSWLVGPTGPGGYRDDVGGDAEVITHGRRLVVRRVVISCSPDGRHDVCGYVQTAG